MTLNQFLAKYAPQFRVEPVSFRPGGGFRKKNHFLFQIRDGDDNQYVSFYSQGIGIYDKYGVPKMQDVFQCLRIDFGCGAMTRKEYLEEFGNRDDSIFIWEECVTALNYFQNAFGLEFYHDFMQIEFSD